MEGNGEVRLRIRLAAALTFLLLFLTLFLYGTVLRWAEAFVRETVTSPFWAMALQYGSRVLLYAACFGIPAAAGFAVTRAAGLELRIPEKRISRDLLWCGLLLPGIVFRATRVWAPFVNLLRWIGVPFREIRVLVPESAEEWILYFILVVLVAPVAEELFFRGLFLSLLRPCGDWFAILSSALLFGLMHGSAGQLFYTTAAGFFLGWIVLRTGSVSLGILMHAVNNLHAFLMEWVASFLPEGLIDLWAVAWETLAYALAAFGLIRLWQGGGLRRLAVGPDSGDSPKLSFVSVLPFGFAVLLWVGYVLWNSISF